MTCGTMKAENSLVRNVSLAARLLDKSAALACAHAPNRFGGGFIHKQDYVLVILKTNIYGLKGYISCVAFRYLFFPDHYSFDLRSC